MRAGPGCSLIGSQHESPLTDLVKRPRIGFFSIGLEADWEQSPKLRERLEGYDPQIAARPAASGVEVVNLGMIDGPQKALAAGHAFRQEDAELIFVHVATHALSSTVLPVVRPAKVPVIVLNLSPLPAIDYEAFTNVEVPSTSFPRRTCGGAGTHAEAPRRWEGLDRAPVWRFKGKLAVQMSHPEDIALDERVGERVALRVRHSRFPLFLVAFCSFFVANGSQIGTEVEGTKKIAATS